MKKVILFLLLIALFGFTISAYAQGNAASEGVCDTDSLQNIINLFIGELGKLKTGSETDPVKIADKLQQLANDANMLRAACDGLVFSGESAKVIGPVKLPQGVYRVTATTDGYMSGTITAVEGECGAGVAFTTPLLFTIMQGQASKGSEATVTSKDCTALIEIANVQGSWKVEFERLTS